MYLDSFAEAASANEERIQETKCAASSKDDQMAEMMARMDAGDDARDEQMRTKDRHIGELIDKLTSLSANKNNNNDNGKANKHKCGPKRSRGSDSSKDDEKAKSPSYNIHYKEADGGKPRINWKTTRKNENWDWWHVQAWERSKLYDEDPAEWKINQAAYKKSVISNFVLRLYLY